MELSQLITYNIIPRLLEDIFLFKTLLYLILLFDGLKNLRYKVIIIKISPKY